MKRWFQTLLSPALYFLLAVILFWPILTHIQQFVVGSPFADVATMFYPLRTFANGEMQLGRLPLWNPYILCGHPLHGEGQGAIFYPLNLAFAMLSPQVSMNLYALLHFAAAGIFFYFYMRACGLRRFSAFFAGFVYMFSSGPISRLYAGHFTIIPFLALVPALMWAWESWRNQGGWGKAGWGALALGCMILAGYPQMLLYASIYFGWHMLVELINQYRRLHNKRALTPLWFYMAVMILGVGVGAVQLLPSYAFAKESFRQQVTYDFIASFSFAPENLITLLVPYFFGVLGKGIVPYWGRNFLWEMWIYIGIFPLAMVILSQIRARRPQVIAHGLAVIIFLVLALGRHTPVHRILYDFVPFFNYFRGSSKFSYFVLFSLTALAGFGVDDLLHEMDEERQRSLRKIGIITLGVFAAIGVAMGLLLGIGHSQEGGALSQLVAWRFLQEETYVPSSFFEHPDLNLIWQQAYPQIVRLILLAAAGMAVLWIWPMLRMRYYVACLAVMLLAFPELGLFAGRGLDKAPVGVTEIPPEFIQTIRQDPAHPRVIATDYNRNAFMPFRIGSPLGYVGNMTTRYNNFLTAASGMDRRQSMSASPLGRVSSRLLWPSVYYLVVSDGNAITPSLATPLVNQEGRTLFRLNQVHPRASFANSVVRFSSIDDAVSALESAKIPLGQVTILEDRDGEKAPEFGPAAPSDIAEIQQSFPMKTIIHTRASGSRLLVLADSFESGWQCKMDDQKKLTIYPVNVGFRGVVVPSGEHTVTFIYQPRSYMAGAVLSIGSLLSIMIAGLLLTFLRKLKEFKPTGKDSEEKAGKLS